MERDLAALEDRVGTLGAEASRLGDLHAPHASHIDSKRAEIQAAWETLVAKAKVRVPRSVIRNV